MTSDKRRRKGFWLFALVILIAALAGGTGWYFGAGPGAQVAIPDLAGQSPAAASTTLTGLGFTVNPTIGQVPSVKIPKGSVVQTTPRIGTRAPKNSQVTLLLSTGPQLLSVPVLVGQSEKAAIQKITDARFAYDSQNSTRQFDAKVAKDTVIAAAGAGGLDLVTATTYGEQQPISLVVSAGAVPNVAGKSFADATSTLNNVQLTATRGRQDFSDTVPTGNVIGVEVTDGTVIRPGDSISLTISRGKEQVAVPDIVGMTWDKAKKALSAAGFTFTYDNRVAADTLPTLFSVATTNPVFGQMADKGSSVKVTLLFSG